MALAFYYILSRYGIGLIDEHWSRELPGYVKEHPERIKAGQTLVTF